MVHENTAHIQRGDQQAPDTLLKQSETIECPSCHKSEWESGGIITVPLLGAAVSILRCKSCRSFVCVEASEASADVKPT